MWQAVHSMEVLESEYSTSRPATCTRSQTIFKVINFESFEYIYYTLASLQLVIIYSETVTYIHQFHNLLLYVQHDKKIETIKNIN